MAFFASNLRVPCLCSGFAEAERFQPISAASALSGSTQSKRTPSSSTRTSQPSPPTRISSRPPSSRAPPFEQRNEQGKQKFAVDIIAAALGAAEHYKLVEEPVRSATKALIGQLELMAAEDAPPPAAAPEPEEGCCCVVS